jgi:hypothetical protein
MPDIAYGSSNDPALPPINLPSFGDGAPRQPLRIVINKAPQPAVQQTQAPAPAAGAPQDDPWAAFPDAPAATTAPAKAAEQKPAEKQASSEGDAWSAFPDQPPPGAPGSTQPAPAKREVETGEAASRGILNSLTFGAAPAIAGLASASGMPSEAKNEDEVDINPIRPVVGAARLLHNYFSDHPDPDVQAAYEKGRKDALDQQTLSQEQHPTAYLAGQLGGALLTPMGVLGPVAKATTVLPRIARGMAVGAGGGALFGTGEGLSEGDNLADLVTDAGKGAVTGGAFGTVGSTGAELLGKGASKVMSIARGTRDVDAEAGRRVAGALASDFENQGAALTPEEIAAGNAAGTPRAIVDTGGERTRALARSSANTSPEGRQALTEMTQSRFEQQSPRIAGFIRNLTGGGHAADDAEALSAVARKVNKPLYAKAYAAGDKPIWSPELERLTGSPSVKAAINGAVTRGKDRAINDGMGAFRPTAKVTPDGQLIFNKGPTGVPTYPNLQFWDYTQRELRDLAEAASRTGRKEEAASLKGLHAQLRAELDRLVPEFGKARQTAASFFGAENALDAGRKFVMMNAPIAEVRRALSKMSAPERELFARGFASDLADKIERTGDSRNVLNSIFLNNSAARQKIELALGPGRTDQLEALLRIEDVVDHARKALGNSTTARQLTEMGLAGGAVATFEGVKEHDFNPTHIIVAALTYGAVRHGAKIIDERVARRVGEMLASDDPAVLAKGVKVVASSPVYFNALRRATGAASRIGAHDIGPGRAAAGVAAVLQGTLGRAEETLEHTEHPSYSDSGQ